VEFLEDSSVEAEVFHSNGNIHNESAIDEPLGNHAEADTE
jgi:hypothetical protein